MKKKSTMVDMDMSKAGRALERAAARAQELAEQTGTPFYILKDGHVVDLNRLTRASDVLRERPSGNDACLTPILQASLSSSLLPDCSRSLGWTTVSAMVSVNDNVFASCSEKSGPGPRDSQIHY